MKGGYKLSRGIFDYSLDKVVKFLLRGQLGDSHRVTLFSRTVPTMISDWKMTDYRRVDVQRTLASTRPPLLRSWLQDFSISFRRSRIRVIGSESRGGRRRRNMNLAMWRNLTKIREKMFAAIIRNT